jgi:ribosomal protein S27E
MDKIDNILYNKLLFTFKKLLKHGMYHALIDHKNDDDYIQIIINIQGAIELLGKMKMIKDKGWKGIILNIKSDISEDKMIIKINNGELKTIQYNDVKTYLNETFELDNEELEILKSFQDRRNEIIHLGVNKLSKKIISEIIILLIRVFNKIGWYDSDNILENQLADIFDDDLYKKLLANSDFVKKAIDYASSDIRYDAQRYCIECNYKTMIFDEYNYYWKCILCGYIIPENAVNFIDCPNCKGKKSVVFDSLNIDDNIYIDGLCGKCKSMVYVSKCKKCGTYYDYQKGCDCEL